MSISNNIQCHITHQCLNSVLLSATLRVLSPSNQIPKPSPILKIPKPPNPKSQNPKSQNPKSQNPQTQNPGFQNPGFFKSKNKNLRKVKYAKAKQISNFDQEN